MKKERKKMGNKGFSMIELIIVIAIMAILVAIIGAQIIPYMEKSRRSKDFATLDTCLTNFKAAVADSEYNGGALTANGISAIPTTGSMQDIFKELQTAAYDEDAELNGSFKSKSAAQGAGNVQFKIDANGLCSVEKGGLKVDSTGSHYTP